MKTLFVSLSVLLAVGLLGAVQADELEEKLDECELQHQPDASVPVCVGKVLGQEIAKLKPTVSARYCRCAASGMSGDSYSLYLVTDSTGPYPSTIKIGDGLTADKCIEALRYPPCVPGGPIPFTG